MPAIDKNVVFEDVLLWLPEQNILNDRQLLMIIESVIKDVGNDDNKRSEIVCKTLRACAYANKSLSIGSNDVKRERSYQREIEYNNNNNISEWDEYLSNLSNLCPLLPGGGYNLQSSSSVGFYASVSPPVVVPRGR